MRPLLDRLITMSCFNQQDRPGGQQQTRHASNQNIHLGVHHAGRGLGLLHYNQGNHWAVGILSLEILAFPLPDPQVRLNDVDTPGQLADLSL